MTNSSDLVSVFRIEHKDTGLGPFSAAMPFEQSLAKSLCANLAQFPNPADDGLHQNLLNPDKGWVFGAFSLDAAISWVSLGGSYEHNVLIYNALEEKGYQIVEYLVNAADICSSWSKSQVVFDPSWSRAEGLTVASSFSDYVRKHGVRVLALRPGSAVVPEMA